MRKIISFFCVLGLLFVMSVGMYAMPSASAETTEKNGLTQKPVGKIYLYGEYHGEKSILDQELEIWGKHYEEGMRDLFVELPCYMAGYLNIWMEKGSRLSLSWGSPDREEDLNFYRAIRELYPETVFHGTDLGHKEYVGRNYLEHLKAIGQQDSDLYRQTEKALEDGKYFYSHNDDMDFRENIMVENFIEEYDKLGGKDIMGIYGNAHITTKAPDQGSKVPSMLSQLLDYYGDAIIAKNLS